MPESPTLYKLFFRENAKQKACHAPSYQRVARNLLEFLDFYILDVVLATINPSTHIFFMFEADCEEVPAG